MRLGRAFVWPMLLLALISIIVYLAGLASIQWNCQMSESPFIGTGTGGLGVFGLSDAVGICRRTYRFYWFTLAFVVATLLGLLASFMPNGLATSRPFWVGMLAISTILMMIASEAFLAFTDATENVYRGGQWLHRIRAVTAGAIMSVAFLILLMLAVGTDWRTDGTGTGIVNKPVSGVGTGAGPGAGVTAV